MKHYSLCIECHEKDPSKLIWAEGEVDSNLISLCTCPKGHKLVSGLMHNLFDILYTSAVQAFLQGSFSESVMSFAASLERTYELFIKVTMLREGASLDAIDSFWKEIKNQSERQYGAFCIQYLKVTGEAWKINANHVSFRNNVVHKGYIATSLEVKKYAEYTTECQFKILSILHSDYKKVECQKLFFYQKDQTKSMTEKVMKENNAKFYATNHPSLLKWNHQEMSDVTFQGAIEAQIAFNKHIGW